jgi:hypothetical protein
MGDKSPKAKSRAQKQSDVRKTQQKEAAALKVSKPAQDAPTKVRKP